MWAKPVTCAFLLADIQEVDGETILIGDCADYEAYTKLPKVLLWEGALYSLTGWNSDKHYACWKITQRIAMPIHPDLAKQLTNLVCLARDLDERSGSTHCWGCGHERVGEDHKADCVLYPGKKSG
jgi:hypothetical protein